MNFWAYIAIFAIGIIAGMIIEWYIIRDRIGDRKTVEIRRNKQKGGPGNAQDLDLELNEVETLRPRKEVRQEKKKAKQAEREARREARKNSSNNNLKPNQNV